MQLYNLKIHLTSKGVWVCANQVICSPHLASYSEHFNNVGNSGEKLVLHCQVICLVINCV